MIRSVATGLGLLFLALGGTALAAPVSFSFRLPKTEANPFERDLWAEVVTPSGAVVRLPAFYAGESVYSVRARAEQAGDYRLGEVTERRGARSEVLAVERIGPARQTVRRAASLPPVTCAQDAPRFVFPDGRDYVPLGMSLAWAPSDPLPWYRDAFREFSRAGLNWTRVWMAHWDGLNLDWLPSRMGASPPAGRLDLRVAADWDEIVAAAEKRGVYLQVVLQHHGQWSSEVNSNWAENPWNAANPGGFLRTPGEFFTSADARRATAAKYRYIVARWGYSPAVLAWELFNEVHWTDAIRRDGAEPAVAAWHREMAARIRSVDVYRHLLTTSLDDLGSPVYADMDYLQPHLYAADMLTCVRHVDPAPDRRPVFYGEIGDDHMPLTDAQKAAGVELVPLVWAGVMGEGSLPPQLWQGELMLREKRAGELGAVARFLAATRLAGRAGLVNFTAAVTSAETVPLELHPGHVWRRQAPPEIAIALDGRMPADYAALPGILVGAPESVADGYPDRLTLRLSPSAPTAIAVRLATAAGKGATVTLAIDGQEIDRHVWPALPAGQHASPPPRPAVLHGEVPPGPHVVTLRNSGGLDWCQLASVDFGVGVSPLAAVGRRGDDFIAAWVWHRTGVSALTPPAAVTGSLLLDGVPAGTWRVTWWDTLKGEPGRASTITHPGGPLRLPTPAIARHAAVVLTR